MLGINHSRATRNLPRLSMKESCRFSSCVFAPISLSLSLCVSIFLSLSLLGGHERDRSWFIFNSFDPVSRLFVCIIRAHFPFAQVVSSVLAIEQASSVCSSLLAASVPDPVQVILVSILECEQEISGNELAILRIRFSRLYRYKYIRIYSGIRIK